VAPLPLAVYLRAEVAGTAAFVIAFSLAAGFSTFAWIAGTTWIGPPIVEREEIARLGAAQQQAQEAELYEQIGRLKMDLEWF
jgi:hypothetical protein